MKAYLVPIACLAAGCAETPKPRETIYVTTYDCSLREERGDLTLVAEPDHVGWSERVDGVPIQAHLSLGVGIDRIRFQQDGFSNQLLDHPVIFFDYPADLKPSAENGYTVGGQPLASVFGGARVGKASVREPVAVNVFLSLDWKQVQSLLQNDGDMYVFLYDAAGRSLRTLQLPRTHFAEIERALMAMHARVLAREAERERLCPAETHPEDQDIIIID